MICQTHGLVSSERDTVSSSIASPNAQTLLDFLTVRMKAFAACDIGEGYALKVPPINDIVIHYVIEGEGAVEWMGGRVALQQGMIAIIPRNMPKGLIGPGEQVKELLLGEGCMLGNGIVRYQTSQDDQHSLRLACATVFAAIGQGLGLFDHLTEPLIVPCDQSYSIMFEGILTEFVSPAVGSNSIIEGYMRQILLLVVRQVLERSEVGSHLYLTLVDYQIARVVKAMTDMPSRPHSMQSLANIAAMTPACLSQRFESIFGQSPPQYLHHVRMNAAQKLLKSTHLPIKTIAGSVGFSSRSHFSRAFSQAYDQDPTTYRKVFGG